MARPDSERELEGLLPLVGDDRRVRDLLTPTRSRQATRKRRAKFLESLYHSPPFPERYVTALSHEESLSVDLICAELRARGAPDECYVISNASKDDATTVKLEEALSRIAEGTILLCIPGRLALYVSEDESDTWIVERRA